MTDHPIVPPPELRKQWQTEVPYQNNYMGHEHWLMKRAAQWGADTELEACIAWLIKNIPGYELVADNLRSARRPKPPSLAEQALEALRSTPCTKQRHYDALFAAIKRLKELEESSHA